MTDPISLVMTSLKTATGIAKAVQASKDAFQQAELKLKFAELVDALTDAKLEMASIQDQMRAKDEEIAALRGMAALRAEMAFIHNAYWKGEPREGGDGPYCPRCLDSDRRESRMQNKHHVGYVCPTCNTSAAMPWTPPPPQIRMRRG